MKIFIHLVLAFIALVLVVTVSVALTKTYGVLVSMLLGVPVGYALGWMSQEIAHRIMK